MQSKKSSLISVIMNCRNGEKYLKKSLTSLINQSYKNWELIFFDNNSYDKSKKIIKSFKDKRIRIFTSKKSLRLYHARNLAIKQAKGKYISFLDVDDLWEKKKLKIQYNFLKKNKDFKFIYTNYFTLFEKTKKINLKFSKILNSGFITQELLNNYSLGILTVFFDASIINKKNFFNKKYNIIGDFDCFIKLSLKNRIAYIKEPLATYRIHDKNYSLINLREYLSELKKWKKNNFKTYSKFSLNNFNYYLIKLRIKILINYFGRVVQW